MNHLIFLKVTIKFYSETIDTSTEDNFQIENSIKALVEKIMNHKNKHRCQFLIKQVCNNNNSFSTHANLNTYASLRIASEWTANQSRSKKLIKITPSMPTGQSLSKVTY